MVHMENTSRIPWRGIVRFTVLCTVYSDPDNNTGIQVLGEWSREWIMLISYMQDVHFLHSGRPFLTFLTSISYILDVYFLHSGRPFLTLCTPISYIQDSFCMPGNIYIRWPGFFWQ